MNNLFAALEDDYLFPRWEYPLPTDDDDDTDEGCSEMFSQSDDDDLEDDWGYLDELSDEWDEDES